uniref:Uncharacterized protein n=1 Tax=Oncorhynchus kisutch TaxID=8019 RepID=A0A8C7J0Q2_ONCKI
VSLKTTIIHLFQPGREAVIVQMIVGRFEWLPELDRKIFTYGPMYLGSNGALVGLIANSLYRSTECHSRACIKTIYCLVCVCALVSAVGAGIYPILLALPVNAGLATRYNTAPMPEKGNCVMNMGVVIVLQVLFGTYLGSRHFDS